jgi:hypothetical protein
MLLKKVKVNNPKNVLVQIPRFITTEFWKLNKDDGLEVHYDEPTRSIIIRPKKIRAGSDTNKEDKGLAGDTARHPLLQGFRQVP